MLHQRHRRDKAIFVGVGIALALMFTSCGGGGGPVTPASVSMAGVTISGASVTFNSQVVGTTSAPQSVTLTNSGNGTLNIASVNVTGTGVNTPMGTSVTTTLNSGLGLPYVSLTFPSVMAAGDSSEAASAACSASPPNYSTGTVADCVDVSTTAAFTGPVQVTVGFNPGNFANLGRAENFPHGERGMG